MAYLPGLDETMEMPKYASEDEQQRVEELAQLYGTMRGAWSGWCPRGGWCATAALRGARWRELLVRGGAGCAQHHI